MTVPTMPSRRHSLAEGAPGSGGRPDPEGSPGPGGHRPPSAAVPPPTPAAGGAAADTGPSPGEAPVGGRRALRLARRERRRIMLVCGFVVALCLALTLLIVWLAGSRGPGGTRSSLPAPTVVTAGPGGAATAATHVRHVFYVPHVPHVPQGGQS